MDQTSSRRIERCSSGSLTASLLNDYVADWETTNKSPGAQQ